MFEKALNARKNYILLRSRFVAIIVCMALLFCPMAFSASAAVLDYNDYVSNITVSDGYDLITLRFPSLGQWLGNDRWYGNRVTFTSSNSLEFIKFYPLVSSDGTPNTFLRSDFPDDTIFTYTFSCDSQNAPQGGYLNVRQFSASGSYIYNDMVDLHLNVISSGTSEYSIFTLYADSIYFHPNCETFYIDFEFNSPGVASSVAGSSDVIYWYDFWDAQLSIDLSMDSLLRQQINSNKQNSILKGLEQKLAENGQTLDEVLQQQQQTNDKLDKLPGQIGDEMQGVIENEKEESKNEGNQFVDQILDALPDPSQDVLAALKGLTDATAYTGTDAVLPIPAIVLPGIDGLFPVTEIWGGTQFDFGEYISMLPSTLLTLVQSLFTIAIVLFCVYELKGIISYCLTLRDSKGG